MFFEPEKFMPENLRYAVSPPDLDDMEGEDLREFAEQGGRDTKNAAVLSLQQAVDAHIEDEIDRDEYDRIEQQAVDAVVDYYSGREPEPVQVPDTDISTRQSGFLTHETVVRHFPSEISNYDWVEYVAPVASGGLEPGIVASEALDADLQVVRYSTNDHGDERPIGIDEEYEGDVLVVDDTSYTGETLETVEEFVYENGADRVESEAVIDGQLGGTMKLVNSYRRELADRLDF
jgi:adenine/guanine phosphoribosyltransferase-like PRPP-binding protein